MRLSVQSRSLLLICGFTPADIQPRAGCDKRASSRSTPAFGGRPKARGHIPNAASAFTAPAIACPEPVPGRIRRRPVLGGLINQYETAA